MEIPKYLKIHLEGGIGDCLKVIMCNFPLQSLYNNYGIQTFVTYGGDLYNDCGWEDILKKEIFDLCPAFIYVNREVFLKIYAPTVADFFRQPKPFSLDLSKHLPLEINAEVKPPAFGKRHIGIQLDSNDARKKFSTKKWVELVDEILKHSQHTHVHLFGAPSDCDRFNKDFPERPRLHNTCGNRLSESFLLISQMSLFISPDSFSKYICLCANVPAVLLCCELSYIGVEEMLRTCFNGIAYNDNYKILGLEGNPLQAVNEIKVKDILKHVR